MSEVKSHIQMPRCVLKQFEDDACTLYYYDFTQKCIKKGHAKSLNREEGYYSEEMEGYLNKRVETPFSQVLHTISRMDRTCEDMTMPPDMLDKILRYLYALVRRSPEFLESSIDQQSALMELLSEQQKHDYTAYFGIEESAEKGFFSDWIITFLINTTDTPFVLPQCGMYSYTFNGSLAINLPITPYHAIAIMHPSLAARMIEGNVIRMLEVNENERVELFNRAAFRYEMKYNKRRVVSNSRELISALVQSSGIIE